MQLAVASASAASTWFGCPTPTCPFRCSRHVGNKAFLFSGCRPPSSAQNFTWYAAGAGACDRCRELVGGRRTLIRLIAHAIQKGIHSTAESCALNCVN